MQSTLHVPFESEVCGRLYKAIDLGTHDKGGRGSQIHMAGLAVFESNQDRSH